jgi:indole-3-glycerol phosphate synthase
VNFLEKMYRSSKRRAAGLAHPEDFPFPVRPFRKVLAGMAVIAEVRYATPKDGLLGISEGPASLAQAYESNGARAISCLTEPDFFAGAPEYLNIIRSNCSLPILMKDFITDRRQIAMGRSRGADAVLLITEMLSLPELEKLHAYARNLGMDCLVEVHSREGLDKAVAVGAGIIGVNCRDLASLKVDPKRHEELVKLIPAQAVKVAESGITSGDRLVELKAMGYDAALVGRALADRQLMEEILHVG